MSQLNESPIITVERRKAVTIIIASVIVALALGVGLTKVGTGFATRAGNGITVTGSAKTTANKVSLVCTHRLQQVFRITTSLFLQVAISD